MKLKKMLCLATFVALSCSFFSGCDDDFWDEEGGDADDRTGGNYITSDLDITKISRTRRDQTIQMGKDGTWTVFVYLCGTDLETEGGMASGDIDEMLAASGNNNVRFIVQTGGTKKWEKKISSKEIQRYEICNGKMTLVDSEKNADMGVGDTLADFVNWGAQNYPAAHMGLILWNHGGGSIAGVCFDESSDDSLSLREIDAALYSTRDAMTDDFEFIGFDACLMGTVETAAVLASHSRYMIASEELEPGAGWDYTALGNYLAKNPNADGYEVGKAICDSYYSACKADGDDDQATLSLIDLSKVDDLILSFREFAKDLYEKAESEDILSEYIRNISQEENFGGNSFWEGYSNMVDMKGVINAGSSYSSHAKSALSAIDNAVVYKKNGDLHEKSCGLSMYYPLGVDDSSDIKVFKDISVSTHYLAFVDKIIYGSLNGSLDSYHDAGGIFSSLIDWTSDFFDVEENEDGEDYYSYDEDSNDSFWSSFLEDYDEGEDYDGEGEFDVDFDEDPSFDSDGNYGFVLSDDSLSKTTSVSAYVYMMTDDMEEIIDMGITSDLYIDWKTGSVVDNFDGSWFCLEDGQPLAVYLLEEGDGFDVYSSPVYVNDEETNLRFSWDWEDGTITILGIWDGIDDNGSSDRTGKKLRKGDVIVPIYNSYGVDDDSEDQYIGDEFTYRGNDSMYFDCLPEGDYLYGFYLEDTFGNSYATDPVYFNIDGDDIYYSEID